MSKYDRAYMPWEEEQRHDSQAERILAELRAGPKTNIFLARIAMDYCRSMRVLRQRGHLIRSHRVNSLGLWIYTLTHEPDPEWELDLRTRFEDGHEHTYTHIVKADTAGKARNVGQRGGVKTEILAVRRRDQLPLVLQ